MGSNIRRVVTGHDPKGKAVVLMDGEASNVRIREATGLQSTLLWVTDHTPADIFVSGDASDRQIGVAPPSNGTIFRMVEFPPEKTVQEVDHEAMLKEMGLHSAEEGKAARHSSMHRTDSVDYAVVVSGEIDLLLDDTEVHLKAGDVVVQLGNNHGWVNREDEPCRVAFVLVGAKR